VCGGTAAQLNGQAASAKLGKRKRNNPKINNRKRYFGFMIFIILLIMVLLIL